MAVKNADEEAIEFIVELIYERARIRLHAGKESLIRARLGKRMRFLDLKSLPDYCAFLRTAAGEEELTHAVDALTTNFTHFLREEDHFKFLVQSGLPGLLTPGEKSIRVWSAACATGEEPYSAAFYLEEHFPSVSGYNWRILATDISTKALAKAEAGVYPQDRVSNVPLDWQRRYFQRGYGRAEGLVRVKPQIRDKVEFRHENLLKETPRQGLFQVIFCRNVMIYFDRTTQEQLVKYLCRYLAPQGWLLIGHSESLNGLPLPLRCVRPSYYQKT